MSVELALADDGDLAAVEVDVAEPHSEDLASAEADEGGEEGDASHPLGEVLDEVVDLGDGGDRALVGRFDAGTLDGAGVGRDQAVLHGRRQDRPEQAVALGRGAGAGSVGSSEAGVPAADLGGGDPGKSPRAEGRDDVQTQLHEVEVLDPWPERLTSLREPGLDPARRVVAERRRGDRRRGGELAVGLVGDRPGVCRLGGALAGVGAEAEASAVGGDDADSIAARGEAVDPASGASFAWHGLLREERAAVAAGGEGPSCAAGRRKIQGTRRATDRATDRSSGSAAARWGRSGASAPVRPRSGRQASSAPHRRPAGRRAQPASRRSGPGVRDQRRGGGGPGRRAPSRLPREASSDGSRQCSQAALNRLESSRCQAAQGFGGDRDRITQVSFNAGCQ